MCVKIIKWLYMNIKKKKNIGKSCNGKREEDVKMFVLYIYVCILMYVK